MQLVFGFFFLVRKFSYFIYLFIFHKYHENRIASSILWIELNCELCYHSMSNNNIYVPNLLALNTYPQAFREKTFVVFCRVWKLIFSLVYFCAERFLKFLCFCSVLKRHFLRKSSAGMSRCGIMIDVPYWGFFPLEHEEKHIHI